MGMHGCQWMLIDDVTADSSGRMDSKVDGAKLCSHSVKCYKSDRMMLHSADG